MLSMELPVPPSMNNYWKPRIGGGVRISDAGKRFRTNVAVCLLEQGGYRFGLKDRVAVAIVFHPPDRRRRDLDNILKALLDALEHAEVYRDDSQIDDLLVKRGEVRPRAGCVLVRVSRLGEAPSPSPEPDHADPPWHSHDRDGQAHRDPV